MATPREVRRSSAAKPSAPSGTATTTTTPTTTTPEPTAALTTTITTTTDDHTVAEKINLLQAHLDKEHRDNAALVRSLAGQGVKYGDVIQLRHLRSQKFVAVQTHPAQTMKNASSVHLVAASSPACLFKVVPRYRFRSTGQFVTVGDLILLVSAKSNQSQALHVSKFPYPDMSPRHEVASSDLDTAAFRLIRFRSSVPPASVQGNQILNLQHAESDALLTCAMSAPRAVSGEAGVAAPPGLPSPELYLRQYGGRDPVEQHSSNAMFQFVLGNVGEPPSGAAVAWDLAQSSDARMVSEELRIRHVPTGLFLAVFPDGLVLPDDATTGEESKDGADLDLDAEPGPPAAAEAKEEEEEEEEEARITNTQESRSYNVSLVDVRDLSKPSVAAATCFRLESTAVQSKPYVESLSCVRIRASHLRAYLADNPDGGSDAGDTSALRIKAPGTGAGTGTGPDGDAAGHWFSLESTDVECIPLACLSEDQLSDADAFRLMTPSTNQVTNLLSLLSVRTTLEPFVETFKLGKSPKRWKLLVDTLSFLIRSLLQFPESDGPVLGLEGAPSRTKQLVMREQRVLDVLADLIRCPFDDTVVFSKKAKFNIETLDPASSIVLVTQLAYRATKFAFQGYVKNELYTAQWVDVFLHHSTSAPANVDLNTEDTLTTLLDDNKELLDQVIDETIIKKFIAIVHQASEPQPRYVKFLTALCALEDDPIASNQLAVVKHLLNDPVVFKDLVVRIRDRSGSIPEVEPESKADASGGGASGGSSSGGGSSGGGGPRSARDRLKARWKAQDKKATSSSSSGRRAAPTASESKSAPSSTAGLEILVPGFYKGHRPGSWVSLANFVQRSPPQHIEYYAELLNLLAEICFGRNETAITAVKTKARYSFPIVLAALESEELAGDRPEQLLLRAAFFRLMYRAFVDVNPVQPLALPQYNRVYTSEPGFLSAADGLMRPGVRRFVTSYFQSLGGVQHSAHVAKNTFTLEVLQVTLFLVRVGAFESVESLRLLLQPLVRLLDGSCDIITDGSGLPANQYTTTDAVLPIVKAKKVICQILEQVAMLDLDFLVARVIKAFRKGALDPNKHVEADKGVMSKLLSTFKTLPLLGGDSDDDDDVKGSWKPIPTDVGDEIRATPAQVSNLVAIVQNKDDASVGGSLDLSLLSGVPNLDSVLFDLVMYDHIGLVNAAVGVLGLRHSRLAYLIRVLKSTQLLVGPTVLEALEEAKMALNDLTSHVGRCVDAWVGITMMAASPSPTLRALSPGGAGSGAGAGAGAGSGAGAGAGSTPGTPTGSSRRRSLLSLGDRQSLRDSVVTVLEALWTSLVEFVPAGSTANASGGNGGGGGGGGGGDSDDDDENGDTDGMQAFPQPPASKVQSLLDSRCQKGKKWVPVRQQQHLLRNVGALQTVCKLMKALRNPMPDCHSPVRHVLRHCHAFLQAFMCNNALNQEAALPFLSLFEDHLVLDVDAHATIAEMCRNNPKVADQFPDSVFLSIMESIGRRGFEAQYLTPLRVYLSQPLSATKSKREMKVLKALLNPDYLGGLFQASSSLPSHKQRSGMVVQLLAALGMPIDKSGGIKSPSAGALLGFGSPGALTPQIPAATSSPADGVSTPMMYDDFTRGESPRSADQSPDAPPSSSPSPSSPVPHAAVTRLRPAPPPRPPPIAASPAGAPSTSVATANPKVVEFITHVIHLLALSARGVNASAERMCQAALSLQDIEYLFRRLEKGHYLIKEMLLLVVIHAYLDVDKDAVKNDTGVLTAYRSMLNHQLQTVAGLPDDELEGPPPVVVNRFLTNGLLPFVSAYAVASAGGDSGLPLDHAKAVLVLNSVVSVVPLCLANKASKDAASAAVNNLTGVLVNLGDVDVLDMASVCPGLPAAVQSLKQPKSVSFGAAPTPGGGVSPRRARRDTTLLGARFRQDIEAQKSTATRSRFKALTEALSESEALDNATELQFELLCAKMLAVDESTCGVVKFEDLTRNLVRLLRSRDAKLSHSIAALTIKALRKLVEVKVTHLTTPAAQWSDADDWDRHKSAVVEAQDMLADMGCIEVLVDSIATSSHDDVVSEAILACCAVLIGGNNNIQRRFLAVFEASQRTASTFCKVIAERIHFSGRKAKAAAKIRRLNPDLEEPDEDKDGAIPELRLLQLLCEGHFTPLQRMLQSQNAVAAGFQNHDLVRATVQHLDLMERAVDASRLVEAVQTVDTLVEFVQGPCRQNQNALLSAKILDTVLAIISWTPSELAARNIPQSVMLQFVRERTVAEQRAGAVGGGGGGVSETKTDGGDVAKTKTQGQGGGGKDDKNDDDDDGDDERFKPRRVDNPLVSRLKTGCLQLLLALLEGTVETPIPEQMAERLDIGILLARLEYIYATFMREHFPDTDVGARLDVLRLDRHMYDDADGYSVTLNEGFEVYFLLRKLANLVPSVADEYAKAQDGASPALKAAVAFMGSNTCSIEAIVGGQIEQVFFPKPIVCSHLTDATRDSIKWSVSRDTPDSKLQDLVDTHFDVQEEMFHRYHISRNRVLNFLSRHIPEFKNWSFGLAIVMNIIILLAFGVRNDTATIDPISASALYEDTFVGNAPLGGVGAEVLILICGITQTVTATLMTFAFFINFAPLVIKRKWRERMSAFEERAKLAATSANPENHYSAFYTWLSTHNVPLFELLTAGPEGLAQWADDTAAARKAEAEAEKAAAEEKEEGEMAGTGGVGVGGGGVGGGLPMLRGKTLVKSPSGRVRAISSMDPMTVGDSGSDSGSDASSADGGSGKDGEGNGDGDDDLVSPALASKHASLIPKHVIGVHYLMNMWLLAHDPLIVYYLLYVLFSLLGNAVSSFFFCFHLMDIVYRVETLKSVLRSLLYNGRQLVWTALLTVVLVYVYTIIGFAFYRNDYVSETADAEEPICETLYSCFFFTLNLGVRNGGGIGDSLPSPSFEDSKELYFTRLFFDLSFFALVVVVLVNGVVFGIIIDTFADLRSIDEGKLEDMKGTCYICGLERAAFDRVGHPFTQHIKNEHNMWNYLYLIVHLHLKEETELTGIESELAKEIEEEKLDWFPRLKALALGGDGDSDDTQELLNRVDVLTEDNKQLKAMMGLVLEKLDALQNAARG